MFRSWHKLLPQLNKEANLLRKDPDHRSRSVFTRIQVKFLGFETGSFSSKPGWFGTSPARQLVQRESVGDVRCRSEAKLILLMKPFTQQVMNYLCGVPFSLCLILNFISYSFSKKEKPLRTSSEFQEDKKCSVSPISLLTCLPSTRGRTLVWFSWTFGIFSCTFLLADGTITAACGNSPPLLLIPIHVSSR